MIVNALALPRRIDGRKLPVRGSIILRNKFEELRSIYPYSFAYEEAWRYIKTCGFVKNKNGVWIDTQSPGYKARMSLAIRDNKNLDIKRIRKLVEDNY